MKTPLQDEELMRAVSGILQRSERQRDIQKLVDSFHDFGILGQIKNLNNQIIYGRRGTGKTHILRVLASELNEGPFNVVLYLDARTLGSTAQFSDSNVPLNQRCLSLFRDILVEIYNRLLDHVVRSDSDSVEIALESLDQLGRVMTEPVSSYAVDGITSRMLDRSSEQHSGGLSLDTKSGVSLTHGIEEEESLERETTTSYRVAADDKVIFPALYSQLQDVLKRSKTTLYILLDEWSSIPLDIQPYLAEFFKRALLPCADVVIKIASLEYRSNFGIRQATGQILGFEVGSDISTALDIDEYFVFDRNPELVTDIFAHILYKHLKSELPHDYLETKYGIYSGAGIATEFFSHRHVFKELVRAAEGVARDLINIFTSAYFAAQRRSKRHIDKDVITNSARLWFEQDKARNLDTKLQIALVRMIKEIVAEGRTRSFLLPLELEKHDLIQKLFDARVLHLTKRGLTDKRNPGMRYNIYSLDYGTYVDLLNTDRSPQVEFREFTGDVPTGFVVPFDDNRALRIRILPEQVLDALFSMGEQRTPPAP